MTGTNAETRARVGGWIDTLVPWAVSGLFVVAFTLYLDVRDLKTHAEDAPTETSLALLQQTVNAAPTEAEFAVVKAQVLALETSTAAGIKRIEDRLDGIYDILIGQ